MNYLFSVSLSISQKVVAGGCVVDVSAIKTLNHELAREAEVVADGQCLFVDLLGREVLRDAAVIRV